MHTHNDAQAPLSSEKGDNDAHEPSSHETTTHKGGYSHSAHTDEGGS